MSGRVTHWDPIKGEISVETPTSPTSDPVLFCRLRSGACCR